MAPSSAQLQLLVAPLGGCLSAVGRPATPIQGVHWPSRCNLHVHCCTSCTAVLHCGVSERLHLSTAPYSAVTLPTHCPIFPHRWHPFCLPDGACCCHTRVLLCAHAADFGCTAALRRGHGVSLLDARGSGNALSVAAGRLSVSAGAFVASAHSTAAAQLQAHARGGASLSLIAGAIRQRRCSWVDKELSGCTHLQGMRWIGAQLPACRDRDASAASSAEHGDTVPNGTLLGAVGACACMCSAAVWSVCMSSRATLGGHEHPLPPSLQTQCSRTTAASVAAAP